MVVQYPDTMTLSTVTESTQNGSGDWVPGAAGDPVEIDCRAEPSGGNGYIKTVSGTNINYSWVVYMRPDVVEIKTGTVVSIVNKDGESVASDKVLRFSRGQLNARIWL